MAPLTWCLGFCPQQVLKLRGPWFSPSGEEGSIAMVTEQEVEAVGQTLVDPQQPLQARFRALFTLRGLGGPVAIAWISRAFSDDSALLKHELAYCLGQMQDRRAIPVLLDVLRDTRQEPMVRHEAGERGQGAAVPGENWEGWVVNASNHLCPTSQLCCRSRRANKPQVIDGRCLEPVRLYGP